MLPFSRRVRASLLGMAAAAGGGTAVLATPPPIMGSGQPGATSTPFLGDPLPPVKAPAPSTAPSDRSPASAAMVGSLPKGVKPGTVVVRGLTGQSETLTAADLAKMPHEHVTLDHMGQTTDFSGPLVSDLLRDVGAPMGVRLHGAGVNDVVFVTAADKYRVVLSLAEVDPSFHKGAKVILADLADGKPLPVKEGPYRLVVEGDLKPSRAAYSVVAIELKHLP